MVYRKFTLSIIIHLVSILAVLFGISFLFFKLNWDQYIYTFIVLFSILAFQVYFLIRFLTRTNRELTKFIEAIKQEDYSLKYPDIKSNSSIAELHKSFNTIIVAFKKVKIDRELQFIFLELIIEHIEIGMMVLNGREEIVRMNTAAEKLLGQHKTKTWRQLKMKASRFCTETETVFAGGRKLIELKTNTESTNLSIEVINTILLDQPHKLITINNIKKEIEQKELDAWIKLIRVLNHEIMNSTTPISSLTETILMLLQDKMDGPKPIEEIDEQVITDVIGSIKTIQRRSNGLYDFVNEYRKLTRVPEPKVDKIPVKELIDDVITLMQADLKEKGIDLDYETNPDEITFVLDPNLIEQVLINLIKNAAEAMDEVTHPKINIMAGIINGHPIISVSDNGPGIEAEMLDEIFIPFFSTKGEGSGIGLSLSRQIMRLHGGQISAQSKPHLSTTFTLTFK